MWEIFDRRDTPERYLVEGEIADQGLSASDIEELYRTDDLSDDAIDSICGLWAERPDRNVKFGLVGFADRTSARWVFLLVDPTELALGLGQLASNVITESTLAAGLAEDVTPHVDDLISLEATLDDEDVPLINKELAFRAFVAKLNAEEVCDE